MLPLHCCQLIEFYVSVHHAKEHKSNFRQVLNCIECIGPTRLTPFDEACPPCRVSEAMLSHFIVGRIGKKCECVKAPAKWTIYTALEALKL